MKKRKAKFQEIGQRIREARESKGLTQSELGSRLSKPLTSTAISLYESGSRDVSVDVLIKIAEILKVELSYLISGKAENPSINLALRADKELWKDEGRRKQVLEFIDFVKQRAGKKVKDA